MPKYHYRKINYKGSLWGIFSSVKSVQEETNTFECRLKKDIIRIRLQIVLKDYPKIKNPIPYIEPFVIAEDKKEAYNLARKIERASKKRFKKLYSEHLGLEKKLQKNLF